MHTKEITNDDIMSTMQDFMQMTSDGFVKIDGRFDRLENRMDSMEGRMDGMEGRMGAMEGRMGALEGHMSTLNNRMSTLEQQYHALHVIVESIESNQLGQSSDIKDILDRLLAIENRLPNITEKELREMKHNLQALITWAQKSAKKQGIQLEIQ